ncbi:uncharacterized protein LOC126827522 isoform X2 [Patella vulgata]|uniref:uncharacterized protein LOC126827522 isoform X2 n=1 Tax=Patella vulgata TaxID=6465 RepID=UPI0024A89318|nr:uncharacterized protein LOC126827522 isoform X2 [Patella vulgata]XP_050412917.2 uncharacterized protein LOC126827522 isoform X2 [Patella vulgata]
MGANFSCGLLPADDFNNKPYYIIEPKDGKVEDHGSPHRNNNPPWKFWRKLSTKRNDRKPLDKSDVIHEHWRDDDAASEVLTPLNSDLPDVLDKTDLKRTNSLKPPPKPPRLFLFRSSSINTHRSSSSSGSLRNSIFQSFHPKRSSSATEAKSVKCPSPKRSASAVDSTGSDMTSLISSPLTDTRNVLVRQENGRIKPVILHPGDRENNNTVHGLSNVEEKDEKIDTKYSPVSSLNSSQNSYSKIKIVTPDLTPKKPLRNRRKSSEKGEMTRQKLIMQSLSDLLNQRFDPFPLLDKLHEGNVISQSDLQAFQGHPDRRLICDSITHIISDGELSKFRAFCKVIQNADATGDISRVLTVMQEIDRICYEIPARYNEEISIMEDEKRISFEIGYLNKETGVLRPLVELEKARSEKRNSNRSSKYSDQSSLDLENESSTEFADSYATMVNVFITGISLCARRADALERLLVDTDSILELKIGKTQMQGDDLALIFKAMNTNTSIQTLDVRLNGLNKQGMEAMSDMLRENKHLLHLNISSTGVDQSGCETLASAMAVNKTLVELDMSFLDIGDPACDCLKDMLKSNSTLKKLRLRSNNITWVGCCSLMEGVSRNRSLAELDLSRNFIGDSGVEVLSRFIPLSAIVELCLENCGITSSGCGKLAEMLSSSKKLKHVDLSVNFIADAGVLKLASPLERSSVLQTIGLNMCGVTNDGFSKLLDVLEKNTSITLLKLCYNRLGREHTNSAATSDNLRYRLRIVTSSKPKLKILLWGNVFEES